MQNGKYVVNCTCTGWVPTERMRYLNWASHLATLSFSLSYYPCPYTLSYLLSFPKHTSLCFCTMLKNSLCWVLCVFWFCSWTSCLLTLKVCGWLQAKVCLLLEIQFWEEGMKILLFCFVPEVVPLATKLQNVWYLPLCVLFFPSALGSAIQSCSSPVANWSKKGEEKKGEEIEM